MKKKRLLTDRLAGESSPFEQEIMENMATSMQKEIDFMILAEMLEGMGWIKIVLSPMTDERGREIDQWVRENCKKAVEYMGLVWIFESSKEAAWFSLRWSDRGLYL